MKCCPDCGETKLRNFRINTRRKDGHQVYCTPCDKQRQKAWYQKNAESAKARARKNTKVYLKKIHEFLAEYLTAHPCVDCNETDILILEFDHERDKQENICSAVRYGWSLERLVAEIEKCSVRCRNCHMRKTAKQQNSWRLKYVPVTESG